MPDAGALEVLAGELRGVEPAGVLETEFFRGKSALHVAPAFVPQVLQHLKAQGFTMLMSVHGLDYWPEEPRLGVQYELLDMKAVDRITVKTRVSTEAPNVPSVTPEWPTADNQEREIFDLLGVVFDGHPNLKRLFMPDDYEGHPQRRDFPIGGEPVLFTHNERTGPGWWK